jgi:hypothetical protein
MYWADKAFGKSYILIAHEDGSDVGAPEGSEARPRATKVIDIIHEVKQNVLGLKI